MMTELGLWGRTSDDAVKLGFRYDWCLGEQRRAGAIEAWDVDRGHTTGPRTRAERRRRAGTSSDATIETPKRL